MTKPQFIHDCTHCKYLGQVTTHIHEYDAYICEQTPGHPIPEIRWELVLRFGNEPEKYGSGLCFASIRHLGNTSHNSDRLKYATAAKMAVEQGLLPGNWDAKAKRELERNEEIDKLFKITHHKLIDPYINEELAGEKIDALFDEQDADQDRLREDISRWEEQKKERKNKKEAKHTDW